MLFIFASAGSIVETAYQFSQSDDKNGTNAVSCVPLHTPGSDSRTRLASKLPVVLSADEVVRFLEAIPSLKSRTALTTVYAAGLRVSEVVLLKIADNDSQRMVIRVEQGKGGKDRYVMLSPQLLRILRTYWRLARPKRWLFPGRDDERPLVPNVLHAACRLVVGLPRSPSRRSSSRATRLPEIEVSKALAGAVVDHHQDAQIRQMIGTIRYGVSSLKPHTFSRAAAQIGLAHAIVIAQPRAVTARDDRSCLQHVTSARGLQRVARVLLDKEDARASGINCLDGAKYILHDQRGETE
jgi:hypothetical protein